MHDKGSFLKIIRV